MRAVLMLVGFGVICLIVQAALAALAALAGVKDNALRRAGAGTYLVTATVVANVLRAAIDPDSAWLLVATMLILLALWTVVSVAAFSISATRAFLVAIPMSVGTLLLLFTLLRVLPQ
jgi:hypothetical protein